MTPTQQQTQMVRAMEAAGPVIRGAFSGEMSEIRAFYSEITSLLRQQNDLLREIAGEVTRKATTEATGRVVNP